MSRLTKSCIVCQAIFEKGKHDSRPSFLERKCCSRPCADVLRSRAQRKAFDEPLKPCQSCGTVMQPRANERGAGYRARKTCNKACGYALLRSRGSVKAAGVSACP